MIPAFLKHYSVKVNKFVHLHSLCLIFIFRFMAHFIIYYLIFFPCKWPEAVIRRCSVKKTFLRISQNLKESTCTGVFFNKVPGFQPAILLKRDSSAGVSM